MVDFDAMDSFLKDGAHRDRGTMESRATIRKTLAKNQDRVQQLIKNNSLDEVMEQLLLKSKKFHIGNQEYTYDNNDQIFFRQGPISEKEKKAWKKCPSCLTKEFKSRKEMVYCTFCGFSNCSDCCKRTKVFPYAQMYNQEKKDSSSRGLCCKLCQRKFFIRQMVQDCIQKIEAQNNSIKGMVKNYQELTSDAKEMTEEDKELETMNHRQVQKLDDEYKQLVDEAKVLITEKNKLDDEYPKLMTQLNDLEESTQQKQLKIAEMEDVYRQIILIKSQYEEIDARNQNKKKIEAEEEEIDRQMQINNEEDSGDDDISIPDQSSGDDNILDNDAGDMNFEQSGDSGGRSDTLNMASGRSASSYENTPQYANQKGGKNNKSLLDDRMIRAQEASAGGKGGFCGAPGDACCSIF